MSTIEDRLRAATRAVAGTVTPGSVPPLPLPAGQGTARRRRPWPYRATPRRWTAVLTPLAAAAAVAAVVAASLAISTAFRGRSHGTGPASAARLYGAPLGGQAALRHVPRYFVALSDTVSARSAAVRSTITGRTLATLTPPRPYKIFTWVSGASDDRTFVLAAQRYWHIASGQAGLPAEKRDNTTPTVFFKLNFDPATGTARLTPQAVPEKIPSSQLGGMTLSPDGTRLALDFRKSVQVVTLATGAVRSWTWPGGGWIGNFKPLGQIFSWTADGKTLAFQQWGPGVATHVRLLDTTAPGSSLASARIVLTFLNKDASTDFSAMNTLLTPDGTRIVTATGQGITEFSVRTGNPVLTEDRFASGWQNVLWAGPHGKTLIVSDPRGKPTRYGPTNILGVLEGNRFTPIPNGADKSRQIAW